MRTLLPAERLIVAADYKPTSPAEHMEVAWKVLELAKSLKGTGVCLKVNSALRLVGYSLIKKIHDQGLTVFADLKLNDIPETLEIDGMLLSAYRPELLTVMCSTGPKSIQRLKAQLSETELLGVTAFTSFTDEDTRAMFLCSTEQAVLRFARVGVFSGGVDGLISSAAEAAMLKAEFAGYAISLNTPAIRPEWSFVEGDDQNPDRIMTPAKAIKAGADRIVVGRPITQNKNPRDAVMRTIEEITSAI